MISYFQALILGIVEGLTEFLPVSSTAHLIISEYLLDLHSDNFLNFLTVFIQLGAIAANNFTVYRLVSLSFIPAVIFGVLLDDFLESLFEGYAFIALSWLLGGIILIRIDYWLRNQKPKVDDIVQMSTLQSIKVGLFQCLAMIPGVSRSGASIVGGRLTGLSHQAAVEYSFLLGIPTILGASAKKLLDYRDQIPTFLDANHLPILAISFLISFIIALVTIRFMVSVVSKYGFKYFGYYRVIVGLMLGIHLWLK
jgi:undecaprenyl-diphosphatase